MTRDVRTDDSSYSNGWQQPFEWMTSAVQTDDSCCSNGWQPPFEWMTAAIRTDDYSNSNRWLQQFERFAVCFKHSNGWPQLFQRIVRTVASLQTAFSVQTFHSHSKRWKVTSREVTIINKPFYYLIGGENIRRCHCLRLSAISAL